MGSKRSSDAGCRQSGLGVHDPLDSPCILQHQKEHVRFAAGGVWGGRWARGIEEDEKLEPPGTRPPGPDF